MFFHPPRQDVTGLVHQVIALLFVIDREVRSALLHSCSEKLIHYRRSKKLEHAGKEKCI